MNDQRQCWPGIRRIASDLHISKTTVKRAIRELEKSGYIRRNQRKRENGGWTSNLYLVKP